MPFDSHGAYGDLQHEVARRPAPRCYARPAPSEAAPPRIDAEGIVLALGLGFISCSAALLLVNGGWSF